MKRFLNVALVLAVLCLFHLFGHHHGLLGRIFHPHHACACDQSVAVAPSFAFAQPSFAFAATPFVDSYPAVGFSPFIVASPFVFDHRFHGHVVNQHRGPFGGHVTRVR